MSQSGRVSVLHKYCICGHPDPMLSHASGHSQGSGQYDLDGVLVSYCQWHILPLPDDDGVDADEFRLTGHPQVSL